MRLLTEFFVTVPWFLPALIAWSVGAGLLTPSVARALRSRRAVVFGLLMSLGVIFLATLLPTARTLAGAEAQFEWCQLDRLWLPPLSELLAVSDTLRNVLLFVPLGLMLALLARTRRRTVLVALAYLLPFAIELTQLLLSALGRGCQSADVIDNALGLTIGLLAGAALRAAVTRLAGDGTGGRSS